MALEIYNIQRTEIVYGAELTPGERAEFDYYTNDDMDTALFVRYDGSVLDLGEFGVAPAEFEGWDGYKGEGFFMGKVLRYLPGEGDFVEVAEYVS